MGTRRRRPRGAETEDRDAPAGGRGGAAPQGRDVIVLDSSSDEFVPSSGGESVEEQKAQGGARPHGLKRLRQSHTQEGQEEEDKRDEKRDGEREEWECARCTYVNEAAHLACDMCLAARTMARQTRKMSAWLATATATKQAVGERVSSRKTTAMRGLSSATETIDSSDEGESRHRTVKREVQSADGGSLWAESCTAKHTDELCVQKKKVQEVQEWLQQSLQTVQPDHHPKKRLLFLCGPPGSGKSTTVRHLAKLMHVTIKEWRDNASAGRLPFNRMMRDEFYSTHVSTWDDFIDFINRSTNYSALPVTIASDRRSRKRPLPQPVQGPNTPHSQLILIETWPQSLLSSQDSTLWDEKLKDAFRQIVNPAANVQHPVVCVFSDVRDKKMDASQLSRMFSDEVLRSPYTAVINFNPVTAAQMKKTLIRLLDSMDKSLGSHELQKIIEQSDGDMRHAINMLQLLQRRRAVKTAKRSDGITNRPILHRINALRVNEDENAMDPDEDVADGVSRDPFFSDFHIVGKLLHSKNKHANGRLLEYDRVLEASAMDLGRVLSLVHTNYVDYYTEVDDLQQAADLMSLSEVWLNGSYRNANGSAAFKTSHDLVRSVVVRSVALTNERPTPSAFRPITAPKTFETSRRMVYNRREGILQQQQQQRQSAEAAGVDDAHAYVCRSDVYSFEMQPFVDAMRQRESHRTDHSVNAPEVAIIEDDGIEDSDGDAW